MSHTEDARHIGFFVQQAQRAQGIFAGVLGAVEGIFGHGDTTRIAHLGAELVRFRGEIMTTIDASASQVPQSHLPMAANDDHYDTSIDQAEPPKKAA